MKVILPGMPYPAQMPFFTARARRVCYGGSRGPGKSWAMRRKIVLMCLRYKGINCLLLRRTHKQLSENHVVPLLKETKGFAKYNGTEKVLTFANGSRIVMGYCDHETDVLQYQGQAYDIMGLEEATHFTEYQFTELIPANRPSAPGMPTRMYFTCNPGGVGHGWVKRLFIDRDYKGRERAEDHVFIPARVYDNPFIMENDPEYVRFLEDLPEDLRRAYLEGDWDVFVGQYFPEFRRDMHTMDPFPLPDHWRRFRAIDYGMDMLACLWAAVDGAGTIYIYREACKSNLIISAASNLILSSQAPGESPVCTFAPKDLFDRNQVTGETKDEVFAQNGLPLTLAANSREAGWLSLKEWFKVRPDAEGRMAPKLIIFNNCRQLIHDIPLLQRSTKNPNDVATEPHDITHAPDALRCLVDGRPAPTRILLPPEGGRSMSSQISDFMQFGR